VFPEAVRAVISSPTVQDPEKAARAIVHILATGDVDAIPSAVAEDYVDHQGVGSMAIRGQDGFRRVVEHVQQQTEVRVTIEDLVAAGDKAAVRVHWEAADDSGRRTSRETLDLLRFSEGRLVEHWGAEIGRRER
jgi:predicted SnoaL-like aldol condensation-catalyzing enzyme